MAFLRELLKNSGKNHLDVNILGKESEITILFRGRGFSLCNRTRFSKVLAVMASTVLKHLIIKQSIETHCPCSSLTKICKGTQKRCTCCQLYLTPFWNKALPHFDWVGLVELLLIACCWLVFSLSFFLKNAASIFGGLLLRPPPGHPTPDIAEKRKAQQFIHQFLLREDTLPWIPDAANLIFKYQTTVKNIFVQYTSFFFFFFFEYHSILYNLLLLNAAQAVRIRCHC